MKAEIAWVGVGRNGHFLSGHCSKIRKCLIMNLERDYQKPWKQLKSEWGWRAIKVRVTPVKIKKAGKK